MIVLWGLAACVSSGLYSVPKGEEPSTPSTSSPSPSTSSPTEPSGDTGELAVDTAPEPHTGTPTPWSRTAVVDGGVDEYGPDERFATTGGTHWITWDADHLYVAARHPDVGAGPLHWLLVYLGDGGPGASVGVQHGSQQPALPTPMQALVRRKADGSFSSLERWDGASWASTPDWLGPADAAVDAATSTVELRIPLSVVGAPDVLHVHVSWLYEGEGFESSYSPTPASSFVDGYDPDYARYYAFDLGSPNPPGSALPAP